LRDAIDTILSWPERPDRAMAANGSLKAQRRRSRSTVSLSF
jgi:hypothetical protein